MGTPQDRSQKDLRGFLSRIPSSSWNSESATGRRLARLFMHEAGSAIEICLRDAFQSRSPVSCRAGWSTRRPLTRSTKETQRPAPAILWPPEEVKIWEANDSEKRERDEEEEEEWGVGGGLIISAHFMENFTSVHCGGLITRIALVSCHLQINSRLW